MRRATLSLLAAASAAVTVAPCVAVAGGKAEAPAGMADRLLAEFLKMQVEERRALEERARVNGISPQEQLRRECPSCGHFGGAITDKPNIPVEPGDSVR